MKAPAETLNDLLGRVATPLKDREFSRKGSSFYLRRHANWGVLNIQKSSRSTARATLFTVNVGVALERLLRFFGRPVTKPLLDDCHWVMRLGALVDGHSDKWWTIDVNTDSEALGREIEGMLLDRAIPETERYLEDSALRDLWLSGRSPGLTEIQRLMNLVVLLAEIGPQERIEPAVRQLRDLSAGKPTQGKVSWLLTKLENAAV